MKFLLFSTGYRVTFDTYMLKK